MDKVTGVLDALQNIFGKGYLLAGLFPVLLAAAVSWTLGCWLSAPFREFSDYLLQLKLLQQAALLVLLLFGVSMIGFVFWLLNPWFRRVLEGGILPGKLREMVSETYRKQMRELEREKERLFTEYGLFRAAEARWPGELQAVSTGTGGAIRDRTLKRDYEALKAQLSGFQVLSYAKLEDFQTRLLAELRQTAPTSDGLREMRDDMMVRFIPVAKERSERAFLRVLGDRILLFPSEERSVGPTRLANLEEARRDYLAAVYGIDVAAFWGDLQTVVAADEAFAGTLEQAKLRLDFSVAMTAAAFLFTTGWIVLHLFAGSDVWTYSLVALTAVGVTAMFRELVRISYSGFADTIRTAVELYRFKLLEALHIELPANSTAEQAVWRDLATRVGTAAPVPIPYHHA